ncbi:MAG: hypothetical protein KatS3mg131_1835 [Candidatus Tectimicrobiota bacterium]|nr:MAG: hypothetical protein KatS3mg131_1835 [Candidatus Tectomicrobia bacterium]
MAKRWRCLGLLAALLALPASLWPQALATRRTSLPYPFVPYDAGKFRYVGIEGCNCHLLELEGRKWKEEERGHHKAMQRLKGAERQNPKCLQCHATAYGLPIKDDKPYLENVQCEACHGPGERYRRRRLKNLYNRDPEQARVLSMQQGLVVPGVNLDVKDVCLRCHWESRTAPKKCPRSDKVFDFVKYYKLITHADDDAVDARLRVPIRGPLVP